MLQAIHPRLAIQVDNAIANDGSKLNLELRFKHFDDFDPAEIVKQVTPLRRLFEARQHLRDLLTKLDGNDQLDQLLQEVVANTEGLQTLKAEPAAEPKAATPAASAAAAEPAAPDAPAEPA